jgi:hypothetical protein
LGDPVAKAVPVDTALGQPVLHRLMIDFVPFAHAEPIGPFRVEQSAHIAAQRGGDIAGTGDEKRGETLQMRAKRLWKALKGMG